MTGEAAYWMALTQLPRWGYYKINTLITRFHHDLKLSIADFFQADEDEWRTIYGLQDKEIEELRKVKSEVPNMAFLAESLQNEGYELIPITSSHYPVTMKENLKAAHAPALLYIKGNREILEAQTVAIVGSRDASERSLLFTENIAKMATRDNKVVVSGFAKGIDKQALDSAISFKGRSIIVLPQGIMTFGSGFRQYYRQIVDGDVLVLSIFFPKAPWRAELAMARNPIIYGLAEEIFVAESSEKGGTWSGVIDGLRKNRKIFVRMPDADESNANSILIGRGAIAVDYNGVPVPVDSGEISFPPIPRVRHRKNDTDNQPRLFD